MNKFLLKILLIIIIGLIQTFLMTRFNPDLIPFEIFIAFGITALGLLIGFITLLTDFKNKQGKINSGLLIMFAFLAGHGIGFLVMRYQNSERRENANLIIEKLDLYFQQKGHYPEKLKDLKPEYLEKIPTSNWGLESVDFEYQLDTLNRCYSIDYKIGTGCGWTYYNGDGWQFYD
ncbi:MAG: hypothetical protein N4A49_05040 [Marinifilaceae bacterium]|nr:hypothetical protein [Marinifilaceae bacterium]